METRPCHTLTSDDPSRSLVGSEQLKIYSLDYDRDGQNVLHTHGHVDWSASVWAGLWQDNTKVYNALAAVPITGPATRTALPSPPPFPIGIISPPADGNDSVTLPTADQKSP